MQPNGAEQNRASRSRDVRGGAREIREAAGQLARELESDPGSLDEHAPEPTGRRSFEANVSLAEQEECQTERIVELEPAELTRRSLGLRETSTLDRPTETGEGEAASLIEQMFASESSPAGGECPGDRGALRFAR